MVGETTPLGGENIEQVRERVRLELQAQLEKQPDDELPPFILDRIQDNDFLLAYVAAEERRKQDNQL